eukprot:1156297-Pelagomonas_calceolata.AAC.2
MLRVKCQSIAAGLASQGELPEEWGPLWQAFAFFSSTPWATPGTNRVCRVAQIYLDKGPAYSDIVGFTRAESQTYMADLTGRVSARIHNFLRCLLADKISGDALNLENLMTLQGLSNEMSRVNELVPKSVTPRREEGYHHRDICASPYFFKIPLEHH